MTTMNATHRAILAADLTRGERNLLLDRFGFNGSGESISVRELARTNGIEVPALRRIEQAAMAKVRPLV